jgi:hypothetical protein
MSGSRARKGEAANAQQLRLHLLAQEVMLTSSADYATVYTSSLALTNVRKLSCNRTAATQMRRDVSSTRMARREAGFSTLYLNAPEVLIGISQVMS